MNCFTFTLSLLDLGISISEPLRTLLGSCHIALVPQPYIKRLHEPPHLKAEFREKWSDIVNQVLRLRPCLQPRSGSPQGGYTPLISACLSD